jgi:3D-(3,5/4)-trihydroxycyclohexane-1,2-dione acylhydrolase (decyclizing)
VGSGGFGTQFNYKVPIDLAANAESLGAIVHRVADRLGLEHALAAARAADRTTVIYVPVDAQKGVPNYECWWDVPVAEVSTQADVKKARASWARAKKNQRTY